MVNTYQLVNPHIAGTFDTKIKAKNSKEASNIFYKNLSEHFSNSIPQFFFTIQKGGSGGGKYFHFKAQEERNEDEVSFKISSYELQNENKINDFKNSLNEIKDKIQGGGKKKEKNLVNLVNLNLVTMIHQILIVNIYMMIFILEHQLIFLQHQCITGGMTLIYMILNKYIFHLFILI